MFHFRILLGISFLFATGFSYAQGAAGMVALKTIGTSSAENLLEQTAKQAGKDIWLEGLSRSTLAAYMLPSEPILKEMSQGASVIGTRPHVKYNQWKNRTSFLGADLSRKIASEISKFSLLEEDHFPGYYTSFPRIWHRIRPILHGLGVFEGILEGAYGADALFEGSFVPTLNQVFQQTLRPIEAGVPAATALNIGLSQALKQKNGFFVIAVKGNERRPKDVLLLDLYNKQFISLYKTQSVLWARENERVGLSPTADAEKKESSFPVVFDKRETSGVMLSMSNVARLKKRGEWKGTSQRAIRLQNPTVLDQLFTVMISHDGNAWAVFAMNSKEGQQIFKAFSNGYYIYFEPKDLVHEVSAWEEQDGMIFYEPVHYTLSFALKKGGPLFPTVREAEHTLRY